MSCPPESQKTEKPQGWLAAGVPLLMILGGIGLLLPELQHPAHLKSNGLPDQGCFQTLHQIDHSEVIEPGRATRQRNKIRLEHAKVPQEKICTWIHQRPARFELAIQSEQPSGTELILGPVPHLHAWVITRYCTDQQDCQHICQKDDFKDIEVSLTKKQAFNREPSHNQEAFSHWNTRTESISCGEQ